MNSSLTAYYTWLSSPVTLHDGTRWIRNWVSMGRSGWPQFPTSYYFYRLDTPTSPGITLEINQNSRFLVEVCRMLTDRANTADLSKAVRDFLSWLSDDLRDRSPLSCTVLLAVLTSNMPPWRSPLLLGALLSEILLSVHLWDLVFIHRVSFT